ncbi:MAG: chromate transporter [Clostridia bacterium]|nr:chromate transporter [Clostridia bacterium]
MLLKLFYEFFAISAFSIGGGYAMIPLIRQRMVELGFLTMQQVADIIAISEMTPGPFAINSATFTGVKVAGVLGGVVATLGVVLPSLILASIAAAYYYKLKGNKTFESILKGIRPVSLALISAAALGLAMEAMYLGGFRLDFVAVLIGVIVFAVMKYTKAQPVLMLILSGVLGIVLYSVF